MPLALAYIANDHIEVTAVSSVAAEYAAQVWGAEFEIPKSTCKACVIPVLSKAEEEGHWSMLACSIDQSFMIDPDSGTSMGCTWRIYLTCASDPLHTHQPIPHV